MRTPIELEPLFPDRDADEPLGRQFVRRLRAAIQNGIFPPSTRLLPSREFAVRLGLSRNTVVSAIEQLIAEGFLETRVGSGTYVAAVVVKASPESADAMREPPASARRFDFMDAIFEGKAMGFGPLRAGVPDVSAFPRAVWSRLGRRALEAMPERLDYGEPEGERELRIAIAQHVRQFRGISADPSCVIVVEGTQAAVRLSSDVLLAENDSALIEDPGYPFIYGALRARSVRVVPVPVDDDGMDVARAKPAKLALVSPSHQFPLGVRMSIARRHALLEWASENDAYIVEDDYDSEYSFDGRPLPALQAIDDRGRVVYVGTFSKTLAPGLRLGYAIVPQHLAKAFATARLLAALGGPRYVQATLADFLSEGHFARHIRRMTRIYGERRAELLELLEKGLRGTRCSLGHVRTGLALVVSAPPDFDDVAIRNELVDRGIWVQPLSAFCVERTDCRGFILGFAADPMPDVIAAARELIATIRSHDGCEPASQGEGVAGTSHASKLKL